MAASRATPAPVIPPPITTTSKSSRSSRAPRASARGHHAQVRYEVSGRQRARAAPSPGAASPGGAGRSRARRRGTPAAARPSRRAQHLRRAPVAGEPARVGAEQNDVGRAPAAGASPPRPATGSPLCIDRRARPASARGRASPPPPSPAAAFSRSSASGPSTRNRHGLVRLWLGAQRASSNSSSSVSRGTGLGSVRLVRAAGPDGVVHVHLGEASGSTGLGPVRTDPHPRIGSSPWPPEQCS